MQREPEQRRPDPWSIEAIRLRPVMYVGTLRESGLLNLFEEVLANAVEEFIYGGATRIIVVRHRDDSLSITDNGRGMPDGIDPANQLPRLTLALTRGSGGTFRPENEPRVAHKLPSHLVCVTALSEWLEVTSRRGGCRQHQRFERGIPVTPVLDDGGELPDGNGTTVRWKPDPEICEVTRHRPDTLRNRLRTLGFLAAGLHLAFRDEVEGREVEYCAPDGLAEYVECLNTGRISLHAPVCVCHEQDEFRVEIAYQYHRNYEAQILGFLNHRLMPEGGIHLHVLKEAVPEVVAHAAREDGLLDESHGPLPFEIAAAGLTAVVSVRHVHPIYCGSTAEHMGNDDIAPVLRELITSTLAQEIERSELLRNGLLWGIRMSRWHRDAPQ